MTKSMKATNLWTMAMAALLTAGCSQNEITDISPDASPAVGFNVYTTTQTRGTVTDNNAGATGIKNATGFGVLAYYTERSIWNNTGSFTPNFMYNQQVKWVTSAWIYTPMKYWPNAENDKISFFAYAPYEPTPTSSGTSSGISLSANTVTGAPTLRFNMRTTAASMIDLVATNATGATHSSGTNQAINITKRANAVAFKFDHVLTRVNFKAKLSAAAATDTYIFVTGMRLIGYNRHDATKLYSQATYRFADGTWDYTATPIPQTTDYDIADIMNKVSQSGTVTGYTTTSIKVTSTSAGDALLNPGEYLFLIPPTDIAGLGSTEEIKVEIDYDIVTKDSKLTGGFSKTSTKSQVMLPTGTLKRNSAYDFLFTIGLDQVQLSATVTDWTETDVAIPSVDALDATATTVNSAIAKLNAIKKVTYHCNYFVVNINGTPTTYITLSAIPGDVYFFSGDRIELKCSTTVSSSGNYTLSGWTSTKSGNSIILTKN